MTELLAAGVVFGGLALILWLAFRSARQAGAAEEVASSLKKGQEAEHVRRDVETVVASADPVQHQRMLDRWRRD